MTYKEYMWESIAAEKAKLIVEQSPVQVDLNHVKRYLQQASNHQIENIDHESAGDWLLAFWDNTPPETFE